MFRGLRGLLDPGDWLGMKPALDPGATTLSLDHTPDPFEVRLRIGIGLGVLAIVSVVIYFVRGDGFAVFVAGGFGFFAALNLIYGLIQSRFEKSLFVTDTMVFVKSRGLLGRNDWDEPVANYRGVLLREEHMREASVGTMESTKTYHVVELAHDRAARTIPLFVREGGTPPREIQEAFSRRFKLPALAPDSRGETARPVGALDAKAADAAPPADPGRPPSGVTVERKGEAVRITVGQGWLGGVLTWLYWLAIPVVFAGIVYQLEPAMALPVGGMVALFILMMLCLARLLNRKDGGARTAIHVDRERIWIERPNRSPPALARGALRIMEGVSGRKSDPDPQPTESLPRNAIEQIRVDTYTSHRQDRGTTTHDRLVIEGDQGRISYTGTQFDKKKLEWVRNYLRFDLAGGIGDAPSDR